MNEALETIEFQVSHLEHLDAVDFEAGSIKQLDNYLERMSWMKLQSTAALTFIYDGEIAFCAGFYTLWPGVAELWLVAGSPIKKMGAGAVFFCRSYLKTLAKTFDIHRFQTPSPADEFHDRWMRALGFQREGLMRKFSFEQKDYVLYARIF